MHTRILRRRAVCDAFGCSTSALDRLRSAGLVTEPIKLSPRPGDRAVGWPSDEITAIVDCRIAGFDEDAQRLLVAELVARRTSRAPGVAT